MFAIRIIITVFAVVWFAAQAYAEEFRVMWYNDHFPPLSFVKDGRKAGMVDDLMRAVCARTGDTYTYVEAPLARARVLFDSGDIDIEPSVSPRWRTDDANKSVYTIPYRKTQTVMLFPDARSVKRVGAPLDLAGLRIGAVRGYSYPVYDELFSAGALRRVDSTDEAQLLERLLRGRADVIFIYKPYAEYMMKEYIRYRGFRFGPAIGEFDVMMRFNVTKKAAVPRFNRALQALSETGELQKIFDEYR